MSYSSVFPGLDKPPMELADLNTMAEDSRVAVEKADTALDLATRAAVDLYNRMNAVEKLGSSFRTSRPRPTR